VKRSTIVRTSAIGAACALAGAGAGIAASSASSPKARPRAPFHGPFPRDHLLPFAGGTLAHAAGPPVHAQMVVPNDKGGFDTITIDRGSFSSLAQGNLTISEGTKTATYKSVTLTIPSNATVRRNGESAQLSSLKSGDIVIVFQSARGTFVGAHDAQHAQRFGRLDLRGFPHHRGKLRRPPGIPPGGPW
jgi:hypothetical protein